MTHSILIAALALMLATLAACGVDGPPTRPDPEAQTQPGVHVSGEARIGVTTGL
ncbi:hypothetical protein [Paracoccus yeei]|uniref:hypothetical protein n=1 Tax=Paracoccus yeei TaxID=147645 RepID=UPI00168A03C0|nr:hypothetical protein [Paracoccus yeei]MBY0137287.1 hypothetical protein [Paracoccus yeei]